MDLKKTTISSYDRTAQDYEKVVNSFEELAELNIFSNLVRRNGRILDLGCGPGHHSKYFADLGFEVTGIDLSRKMISIAKKKYEDIDFRVMDIYDLKFDFSIFDGIWASASLLHIEKDKLPQILLKLKFILKRTGVIYISLKVGYGESLIYDNRYGGVPKFYSFFQLGEIKKILLDNDLVIYDSKEIKERDYYDTNMWLHLFVKNDIKKNIIR